MQSRPAGVKWGTNQAFASPSAFTALLIGLFLAALVPSGALALWGSFDGLYGQDAFAYYEYATDPLRESLLRLVPPPPFFWPPGYPLLVAWASLILGPVPLAGQLVSLIAGGLVPVFTALLAREVWPPASPDGGGRVDGGRVDRTAGNIGARLASSPLFVPGIAGLVAALAGQLGQSSVVIMADTTGLAAATLGMWALARYGRRGGLGWLILAGIALAWAILTRWAYALVAVPAALYGLWLLVLLGRRAGRRALAHGLVAGLVAGLILGPVLIPAAGSLLTPTGDTASTAGFVGTLQVYAWDTWQPLNAARREFTTTGHGVVQYALPNGLYYALAPAHRFFFTPLLAPLIVPGLLAALRRPTPALVCLILGWAALVYASLAGTTWQNLRYTLAYLPPLAVLIAIGAGWTLARAGKWSARLVVAALLVGLAWQAIGDASLTQRFIERKQADLATVRWVESQAPPESRLLTIGLTHTFRHYGRIETLELFELSPADLAELLAEDRPTFLLIDVAGIETQWRGRAPAENYHWLRAGPGLVGVGQRGPYTLFRVRADGGGSA